jgi:hypothetical protein
MSGPALTSARAFSPCSSLPPNARTAGPLLARMAKTRFDEFAWRARRLGPAPLRARSRSPGHSADAPEIRQIRASVLAAILQTIAPKAVASGGLELAIEPGELR